MSKFIIFFLLFCGMLFVYPQMVGTTKAQTMTISPQRLTNQNTDGVNVKIEGLIPNNNYSMNIQKDTANQPWTLSSKRAADSNGEISFKVCPVGAAFGIRDNCGGKAFLDGTYAIKLHEYGVPSPPTLAEAFFEVIVEIRGKIEFLNTEFKTTNDITINVSGINNGSYKVLMDYQDPKQGGPCIDANNGGFEVNLGKYYEGDHLIQIYTNQKDFRHPFCGQGSLTLYRCFKINNKTGGEGCAMVGVGTTSPTTFEDVCKKTPNKCAKGGGEECLGDTSNRGPGMKTAIGCIHTNPTELVKDFMKFGVGIGGGLAFLMMLLGAFQMLTSAGNPETLNAGRERLTSAIIGLLFIIFAVLLLKIIGVDILAIPGFK